MLLMGTLVELEMRGLCLIGGWTEVMHLEQMLLQLAKGINPEGNRKDHETVTQGIKEGVRIYTVKLTEAK